MPSERESFGIALSTLYSDISQFTYKIDLKDIGKFFLLFIKKKFLLLNEIFLLINALGNIWNFLRISQNELT